MRGLRRGWDWRFRLRPRVGPFTANISARGLRSINLGRVNISRNGMRATMPGMPRGFTVWTPLVVVPGLFVLAVVMCSMCFILSLLS